MMEFLNMGGYGAYIWTAYGVSAFALVGLLISSLRAYRAANALVWSLEEDRHVYQEVSPDAIGATKPLEDCSETG